jgi:hypothetical protein
LAGGHELSNPRPERKNMVFIVTYPVDFVKKNQDALFQYGTQQAVLGKGDVVSELI